MAQINCIREMYFEKGMNYASIARATGHDVKTVKKYINMKDFTQPLPKPAKKRGSKLDKYKEEIDSWLEADKQARKKQRHTARRVFDRLAGIYGPEFNCSYRLVAAYVAERKKALYSQETQFFMPLEHIPGEAQVDFGEADFVELYSALEELGKLKKYARMLVRRAPNSVAGHRALGRCYLAEGDTVKAREHATRARELSGK
ncbi:MAG: hypothetical protein ACOX2G_07550 [Bacillota bacterium]|jgi:hypothetical protein